MKQNRISNLKANKKITIESSNERKKEEDISAFFFGFMHRIAVNVPKLLNSVLPLHSVTPKKEVISSPLKSKNSTTPPCKNPKNTNKQLTTT